MVALRFPESEDYRLRDLAICVADKEFYETGEGARRLKELDQLNHQPEERYKKYCELLRDASRQVDKVMAGLITRDALLKFFNDENRQELVRRVDKKQNPKTKQEKLLEFLHFN